MDYTTAKTEWPEHPLPDSFRQLIVDLHHTLDDSSDDGTNRLADEIFAPDGEMVAHETAKGTEGIREARKQAWNVIKKRRHEILRVYRGTFGSNGLDVMLLGQATVELKNGKELSSPYAARVVVGYVGSSGGKPKVKLFQPIADTGPVVKAMQAN